MIRLGIGFGAVVGFFYFGDKRKNHLDSLQWLWAVLWVICCGILCLIGFAWLSAQFSRDPDADSNFILR